MKTEVTILNFRGNLGSIRKYAYTIASMSAAATNAYVMAFDKDNEILWTVQAGDNLDEVKATINWQGVRRVEIYDHSVDGMYKVEYVYITSQKSLDAYTAERSAADFQVVENRTQYEAIFCEEENSDTQSDDSDTQSDDRNEVEPTADEPSRLAQMAEKVAEKAKTFATRAAFLFAIVAVIFPHMFTGSRPEFLAPGSFYWHVYRSNI